MLKKLELIIYLNSSSGISNRLLEYNFLLENKGIKYEFAVKSWLYPGPGAWHFVSLPKKIALEIRSNLKSEEEGWGRLKAMAKIGSSEWKTAIWFDTKMNTYLLPLKSEIRKYFGW